MILRREMRKSWMVARSPKQVVLGGGSKQIESDAGAKDAAGDVGEQGPVEPALSHEEITRD